MSPEYAPLKQIVGVVGRDPEEKKVTARGESQTILTFSVAVSDGYGENAKTTWYNIAVWNTELQDKIMSAGLIYKGAKVAVEGPEKVRQLDNGTTSHDISAFRVGLVEWISKSGSSKPQPKAKPVEDDDDF